VSSRPSRRTVDLEVLTVNHSADARVSITSARTSRSADIRRREVRYLMSMGIRTLCFVGAFFAGGVLRWVLVAAAVFLPYVAVVIANAADRREVAGPASFMSSDRPMLEAGPGDRAAEGEAGPSRT
jgi:hypothetical protein